jgi:hypothetical protein
VGHLWGVVSYAIVLFVIVAVIGQSGVVRQSYAESLPVLPPTVEGPGLLLPDSPLYFLDEWKQKLRLLFSITPEQKAYAYQKIAGERLAELRFVLQNNETDLALRTLDAYAHAWKGAGDSIQEASMRGGDTSMIASSLYEDLLTKRSTLDGLSAGSNGELQKRIEGTQIAVEQARVLIQSGLSDEAFEQAVVDEARRLAIRDAIDTLQAAQRLEISSKELVDETLTEAQRLRRADAIGKAIEDLSVEQRAARAIAYEEEIRRIDMKLKLQRDAASQAAEIVRKARQTAEQFKSVTE